MLTLVRTDSGNPHFMELVKKLDADLADKDGADHSFYAQYNTIAAIKHVIVAYDNDTPVACGAIKEYNPQTMEVKRMYTLPAYRGQGIAGTLLGALEKWAAELSFKKCVLETGKRQPDAISLYRKKGYNIIPNYGQYAGVDNSLCFEKEL